MGILEDWGWDARWAEAFASDADRGRFPARLVQEQRGIFHLVCEGGERTARVTGAMRHKAASRSDLPAVGDWVAAEVPPGQGSAVIRRILPRRTKLSRQAAGEAMIEQVLAANLDVVLVMTALNAEFNVRRLERFLAAGRESGAETVLVLNKLDACCDPEPFMAQARSVAAGAAVLALSAKTGGGLEALSAWLKPGRTIGLVGSSGVGKSTLVNRLAGGEKLRTAATRASDERGRHTTAHRQLFVLPGGGVLLDTPGMREMRLWEAEEGLAEAFEEVEELARACRFKDCGHDSEPGCAVKAAAQDGTLPAKRLESWRKLRREAKPSSKPRPRRR